MSLDNTIPAISYIDPWQIDFPKRIQMLCRGKKRVAYFYEAADISTFRYRIYNMSQVLNENADEISASYFFLSDMEHLETIANNADLLVICRARYDGKINRLIHAFRKRDKKIIFDVDDLVFDVKWAHLLMRTLNQSTTDSDSWNHWFAYISRIGLTLQHCDAAITTNAYLAERIKESSSIPTAVVPNFLNKEQLDISQQLYEFKFSDVYRRSDSISLGYFSGSPSHQNDFALVVPFLEKLFEKSSNLSLVMAGYIDADTLKKRFGHERIRYVPFADFINLQRMIASVDFNLVPLQYNTFTHSKSQLKYFEAAVVGTQTIASPTFTYTESIRDGYNGYLAHAHQWGTKIQQAIDALDYYPTMAECARNHALLHFGWSNQRDKIIKALWGD